MIPEKEVSSLVAHVLAIKKLSKSSLVKAGCVIHGTDGIVYTGYNGNGYLGSALENGEGKANPGVIHAEADAIAEACRKGTHTLLGAIMVVTLAPCINCAALISNTGIKAVWYIDDWDKAALDLLKAHGISVRKLKIIHKKP